MSPDIWMQCGGKSNLIPLRCEPWRVVESQHVYATRKLVDSTEEQLILEEEIERAKPGGSKDDAFKGLHYLLFTPFRYPPLRQGSRFGGASERGIWYGAISLETGFAEKAYYRFLLREGTEAALEPDNFPMTAYNVEVESRNGVDLTQKPFTEFQSLLTSKTFYAHTQPLGSAMRADEVALFLYSSSRLEQGSPCVGVFTPQVFQSSEPKALQTWELVWADDVVEFRREGITHAFKRDAFLLHEQMPAPGLAKTV